MQFATTENYVVELDPESGASDVNIRPDSRFVDASLCRLPQNSGEVAITDIKADMFIRFGYKDAAGNVSKIEKPDDLIGKAVGNGFVICGVYSTEQNKSLFEKYDIDNYPVFDDSFVLNFMINTSVNSPIMYSFVCDGYQNSVIGEDVGIASVLLELSGDIKKDVAMLKKLSYSKESLICSVILATAYSGFAGQVNLIVDYAAVPGVIAVIFSVFSVLLLMNFLTVSLDFKKYEIGILRALGASAGDILLICLAESGAIALIDFCLSLAGTAIVCAILNAYFFISIFNIAAITVLSLLLLCFGAAAFATVFPVLRLLSKKPVEIISNK